MSRRALAAFLILALNLTAFPAWSQVGRVTLEIPSSPTPSVTAALNAAGLPLLGSPAALTPSLALTPALSAPSAERVPQYQPVAAAQRLTPLATIAPIARVVPASTVVRPSVNVDRYAAIKEVLVRAAASASVEPKTIGRLYDNTPAAPDFEFLATVKTPAPPAPWRPSFLLLKPAAAVLNTVASSRYAKRLAGRLPHERVTTEEMGMQDTLSKAHASILSGRLQDALERLSSLFKGRDANRWYRANTSYLPYQFQGHDYIRFIERAVKLAYERAHSRARDASLIAEARAAARDGSLIGHEWRITQIQDKDSAHCAHHALFNAISASVGFVYPLSVHRFVERARELLNVRAESVTTARGAELASLQNSINLKLGVDVGEGMGIESIKKWAKLLGLGVEARGPPATASEWSALIGRGREVMISLRMFHERYKHSPEERALHGHDYEVLHHEVYLLGAFDSRSRGERLYMVQDSGSGATDFYTAEELTAVASDIQILRTAHAVALP